MSTSELSKEEKLKQLKPTIGVIKKAHGEESIIRGKDQERREIPCFPTGLFTLDKALGIGGIPKGRIIEIFGNESGGKTSLCLHIAGRIQKQSGLIGFIDAEHALDPKWATKLGLDVDDLLISQPNTGEEGLEIAESLIRSNLMDLIIIDSVAALVPKSEIEKDMGESSMGRHALLMSQACRKLTSAIAKTNTTVIFINQIRDKFSTGPSYGPQFTTPGGHALKFFASVRMEIRRMETLKRGEDSYGIKANVKIVKNKVSPPFKTAQIDLIFDQGWDEQNSLIEGIMDSDVIDKAGAWITYKTERFNGKAAFSEYLKSNPAEIENLRNMILFAPPKEDKKERAPRQKKGTEAESLPSPVQETEVTTEGDTQ